MDASRMRAQEESAQEVKLCSTCRHFQASPIDGGDCKHPKNLRMEFINGTKRPEYSIQFFRSDNLSGQCGSVGKFHEAKEKAAA